MPETVSEFRALRATILRLWNETDPAAMASDLDGIIRFNEAVDKVLAESVVRYATDKEAIARQLETDRREATLLSDTIIDSTPDDFFMIDAQFRLVRWNQFFRKQTGLTDEELKGKPILTLIAEEDRPMAEAKFMTAVAMGYISMEVRVQTIHGVRLYFMTARRLDVNGATFLASFGMDVTQRRLAEEALAEEKEFFDAMVQSTPALSMSSTQKAIIVAGTNTLTTLPALRIMNSAARRGCSRSMREIGLARRR